MELGGLGDAPIMLPDSSEVGDGMAMGLDALEGGRPSPLQVAAWNEEVSLIDDITSQPRRSPQKRLEQMIEFDEQQAAAVLKQWIHRKEAA